MEVVVRGGKRMVASMLGEVLQNPTYRINDVANVGGPFEDVPNIYNKSGQGDESVFDDEDKDIRADEKSLSYLDDEGLVYGGLPFNLKGMGVVLGEIDAQSEDDVVEQSHLSRNDRVYALLLKTESADIIEIITNDAQMKVSGIIFKSNEHLHVFAELVNEDLVVLEMNAILVTKYCEKILLDIIDG